MAQPKNNVVFKSPPISLHWAYHCERKIIENLTIGLWYSKHRYFEYVFSNKRKIGNIQAPIIAHCGVWWPEPFLAHNLFITAQPIDLKNWVVKFVVHYLIDTLNKSCKSRKISTNLSALENMINIQTWISHFLVQDYGLDFHSWKFGFPNRPRFGACVDWPPRNIPNILKLLELFWKIISRLGTKWTYHINESLLKPRKHLNISVTFYLVDSTLCIVRGLLGQDQIFDEYWI